MNRQLSAEVPLRARRAPSFLASTSLLAPLAVLAAVPAFADPIQVTLRGAYVEAIQSNGANVSKGDLRTGHSTGAVIDSPFSGGIHAADDRDLQSYFARHQTAASWVVELGSFSPSPGAAADFFVFDVGGNDVVRVRPRMAGGAWGAWSTITGWSDTGFDAATGPNQGQSVFGLGIRFESLKRPGGAALQSNDVVEALEFDSSTFDGAAFLARETGASSGPDGNGAHVLEPTEPSAGRPMALHFEGPWFSETDGTPNPFLDRRLNVTFRGPGHQELVVPGYFDADGGAGDAGRRWTVRFTPPSPGAWVATASFRAGLGVAVSLDPNAGSPLAPLDGRVVPFFVRPTDPTTRGYHRYGTLVDEGRHYRKFRFGPWFLKIGSNGPENFLAYRGFDGTAKDGTDGTIHRYAPHEQDWQPGDPLIPGRSVSDDGRGIIGSLNYLSSKGVNSLFMITMNLGGDGRDVYPFIGLQNDPFVKRRYDTSKLRQWDMVFEHAARKSISLNICLGETETANETWLDNGLLGVERKLFYREMVARFGHHQAIKWTVTEENDFPIQRLTSFAQFIDDLDPYDHPIAVHNNPDDLTLYQNLAGNQAFDATALQFSNMRDAGSQVELVRAWSAAAGRPWVADADEQGPWTTGLTDTNAVAHRKEMLWDVLMSGGGVEFYFGYHALPLGGDLSLEDYRTRDEMWTYVSHARSFFETSQMPFWDMEPADSVLVGEPNDYGGGEVLARLGDVYAGYVPRTPNSGMRLDLRGWPGQFQLQWFDPRSGSFVGNATALGAGDRWVDLPPPPAQPANDWAFLVTRETDLWANTHEISVSAGLPQGMLFSPGVAHAGRPYALYTTLSGTTPGTPMGSVTLPINIDGWTRYGLLDPGILFINTRGTIPASGVVPMRLYVDSVRMAPLVGSTMHHAVLIGPPFDYASEAIELRLVP